MNEDGELIIIDFEYAQCSYRDFDIANHFCEWMADYHSTEPHVLHKDRYPSDKERDVFFKAYDEQDHTMEDNVNQFRLASHLLWGLWGRIMAASQESDTFDYQAYSDQRLLFYASIKNALYPGE